MRNGRGGPLSPGSASRVPLEPGPPDGTSRRPMMCLPEKAEEKRNARPEEDGNAVDGNRTPGGGSGRRRPWWRAGRQEWNRDASLASRSWEDRDSHQLEGLDAARAASAG